MRKIPFSLEVLRVGLIYETFGERYQLVKDYADHPHAFDLVRIDGDLQGNICRKYVFREWLSTDPNKVFLWEIQPIPKLEDML